VPVETRENSAQFLDRPSPPRAITVCWEKLVVNQERKEREESEPAQTYGPPSRLPGRTGFGCLSVTGCWQVFGLASASAIAGFLSPQLPGRKGQCFFCGVVLAYRCGAAPDSHRVPFCSLRQISEPTRGGVYSPITYMSRMRIEPCKILLRDRYTTSRKGGAAEQSYSA
jgi:hypothetical protein